MEQMRIHGTGTLRRERPRKASRRRARSEQRRSVPLIPERGWTQGAWERCVETEALIDLREWLEADGCPPLPETFAGGYGFTADLWTFVETLPFAETGPAAIEERVGRVHLAATRALHRTLFPILQVPAAPGGAISFAAPIRSRSCDRPWSLLRLHVEHSWHGPVFLTIGLERELRTHPALLAAS